MWKDKGTKIKYGQLQKLKKTKLSKEVFGERLK